jgi:transposase
LSRISTSVDATTARIRDRLDGLCSDEDCTAWYPRDGRPELSPAQLATVCVLQYAMNLSDRQAAEAVRCRIDFTYALGLDLDDPGFHHSVLSDFRDRLAEGDRADRLLGLALTRIRRAGLLKGRVTQRTDSTHGGVGVRSFVDRRVAVGAQQDQISVMRAGFGGDVRQRYSARAGGGGRDDVGEFSEIHVEIIWEQVRPALGISAVATGVAP